MADYKISIGAELRTNEIDSTLKSYDNKKVITVNSKLDESGLDRDINGYTPPKVIEVKSKLISKGITDVINKYKNEKKIKVQSDLDTTGIRNELAKFNNVDDATKIRVKAAFARGQDIRKLITDFNAAGKKPEAEIDVTLREGTIDRAIKRFMPQVPVPVNLKVTPDFTGFDTKVTNHKVEEAITVPVKVEYKEIINQVKGVNAILKKIPDAAQVELKAKLIDNGIHTAIKDYESKAEVPVGLTIKDDVAKLEGDIAAKLKKYVDKPPEIPVKLKPATKGFATAITKSPIPIQAKLADDALANINAEIGAYTPTNEMSVRIRLENPKDINSQVKGLAKPTETFDVKVDLDENSVNQAIALFQPTATLGVKPDLILEDVDEQIRAYIPKTKLKVNIDLNEEDIGKENAGRKINTPIEIGVKLDKDSINEAIKTTTPQAKLKVPVKLDFASHKDKDGKEIQKGISKQIKEYQTKTKVKVGVQLDTIDVEQQIGAISTNTLVNLRVQLDPTGVQNIQNEISNIRQQLQNLNNININLGGNGNRSGGNGNNGNGGQRGARRQADDTLRAYRELISLQNRIATNQKKVANLGPDTSENQREIIALSNLIDDLYGRYQRIHQLFNGRFDDIQTDALNRGFQKVSENLTVIISKADDARSALARSINTELGNGGFEKQIVKIEGDISKLQNVSGNVRSALDEVRLAFRLMQDASASGNIDDLIAANRLYEESLKAVKNQLDINKVSNSSAIQSQAKAYKELISISKEMGSLEKNIEKLKLSGGKSNQIDVLEQQLKTLQSTYKQLVTTMETPLTDEQWSAIYTNIAKTSEEIERLKAKYLDVQTALAGNIKSDISNGNLQRKINDITESFNLLRIEDQSVQNDIKRLQELLGNMDSSDDIESVTQDYKEFSNLLQTVNNKINELQRGQRNSGEALDLKKASAIEKLNNLFEEGSQASKKFGQRARDLAKELNACGDANIDNAIQKLNILGGEVKRSGLRTKTLSSSIKEQFQKYGQYISVASVFMYATQAARSMFEQVKLIDSAMTELKKVTDETDATYNEFLSNAAKRSKELGTTIDGLVSSTADFARLGYGFEEAQGLAEVANVYAVVGDEIEGVEDATQSLVSTLAAFKAEMNGMNDADFAMSIVDKMNEVSNNFAISSGGIGEALQRSASSMAAANNSLDETIAMITAANTVAQNPEKVGNAFKTMSMRIRGAKTELEEAGESTDGMASSTASLRQEMLALSGVDIMLDSKTFKSTYQIMDELSNKWEDLSDIAQASIIELVAGKMFARIYRNVY